MLIKLRLQPVVFLSILCSAATFAQETSPLPDLNPEISVPESVSLLRAQITEVEQSEDSFGPKLGELSFELGLQLSELGLNQDALSAFQRSDQNMKVREGLYSENRELSVRKIHEQYIELKNWESAGVAINTLAWLKARNMGAQSVEYVEVLQEVIGWNLALDYYHSSAEQTDLLVSAHDDLEKIYNIYENRGQPIDSKTAELVIAVNHRLALRDEFSLTIGALDSDVESNRQVEVLVRSCERQYRANPAQAIDCARAGTLEIRSNTRDLNRDVFPRESFTNSQPFVLQSMQETRANIPQYSDIDNEFEYDIDPSQDLFTRSFVRANEVLMEQVEVWSETDDTANTLQAILNLADWNLLFGYQENAEHVYKTAWNFAESANIAELMDMLAPEPISIEGLVEDFPLLGAGSTKGVANFALMINTQGIVEQIEAIESDIEDAEVLARLTAEVSMSRFRPILREGVPIASVTHSVSRQISY